MPNVTEGRDAEAIHAIEQAFVGNGAAGVGARLLDVHSDPDHDRSVFTLAARQGELSNALLAGARVALERVDVMGRDQPAGQHPYVGAVDVVPVVYLEPSARGAACAEALLAGDRIGSELGVPVFLYGELAGDARGVRRAELRRGGVRGLAERIAAPLGAKCACRPDFGPAHMHRTAGATLLAARPPLVAFNLELQAPATLGDARALATLLRDGGGEGLPGLRAMGVRLAGGAAQLSMNVERPLELPLARVVEAVARHAAITSAEIVGLVPQAALEGLPQSVELPGFDPERQVIEKALGC